MNTHVSRLIYTLDVYFILSVEFQFYLMIKYFYFHFCLLKMTFIFVSVFSISVCSRMSDWSLSTPADHHN